MKDIKVISIRVYLPVTPPVFRLPDKPPSIKIVGDRFLEARYVYINDYQVDVFAIMSNAEIIAQIPDLVGNSPINKIVVAGETYTAGSSNLLHFDFGNTFRTLQGIERIVQHFVKILLQKPGSNKFNPGQGGGLLSMIGSSTLDQSRSIIADIIDAVDRTKTDIVSAQTKRRSIPLDERLLNVSIDNIFMGNDKVSIILNLSLTTMAGNSLNLNISF